MGLTHNNLLLEQLFFPCLVFLFLSFIFLLPLLFPTFSLFLMCSLFFLFLSFIFEKVFSFSHFVSKNQGWFGIIVVMFFSLFNVNLLWCVFSSILFVMFRFYVTLCFFFYFFSFFFFFFCNVWMLYIYIYIYIN